MLLLAFWGILRVLPSHSMHAPPMPALMDEALELLCPAVCTIVHDLQAHGAMHVVAEIEVSGELQDCYREPTSHGADSLVSPPPDTAHRRVHCHPCQVCKKGSAVSGAYHPAAREHWELGG